MSPDLVVRGGTVIDPDAGTVVRADVAVAAGSIVAVGEVGDAPLAREIDATGLYVTPGLVDLHAHVNWRTSPTAVNADALAPDSGVTTWVDAGSAFATTVESLRENVIERSPLRILSLLRLGFDRSMRADCDPDLLADVARRNRDIVVGIKVSLGQCDIDVLRRALRAAELSELPLMVHIAQAPPQVREVLDMVRPGDIITHALTGQTMRIVEEDGVVMAEARAARDRGVWFDVGHGAGSFSWVSAEAAARAGFLPDTISTDAWQMSVRGPMFDLPTCLSKLLHLGMPLLDVVKAVTSRPAAILGRSREFGSLGHGVQADLTILRLAEGRFPLYDSFGEVRVAGRLLRTTMTVLAGRPMSPTNVEPRFADWLTYALNHSGFDPNPQGGVRPEALSLQERLRRDGHTPARMIDAAMTGSTRGQGGAS